MVNTNLESTKNQSIYSTYCRTYFCVLQPPVLRLLGAAAAAAPATASAAGPPLFYKHKQQINPQFQITNSTHQR